VDETLIDDERLGHGVRLGGE
jgi:hypothetical protein